jgi:hypothetical protein
MVALKVNQHLVSAVSQRNGPGPAMSSLPDVFVRISLIINVGFNIDRDF